MPHSIRVTDTSTVPAQQRRVLRMSTPVRVVLIVYGVCLLVTFAALFWLVQSNRDDARRQSEAITRELDRRTEARDERQRAQNARVNEKLCRALEELPQTPGIRDLAVEFRC